MNSFSSELGVQFGTCLEAPHVVDTESQVNFVIVMSLLILILVCSSFHIWFINLLHKVWAAVISTGPDNYPLNASYRTADEFAFQVPYLLYHWYRMILDGFCACLTRIIFYLYLIVKDALGKTLEDIFTVVPAGSLVFFPSYKLMEKLCNRWRETGQWSRLNVEKSLFVGETDYCLYVLDHILDNYSSWIAVIFCLYGFWSTLFLLCSHNLIYLAFMSWPLYSWISLWNYISLKMPLCAGKCRA